MKFRNLFLTILFLFVTTTCEGAMSAIVVDAESGQPIEGAVILVEWTKTKGLPGMSYTESYKVVEVVTDKEGKASVGGVLNPFVSAPRVTVYKRGYVAWNNEYIFPDWKKRIDFKWSNNYVFKLEKFKPEYSYDKHTYFLHNAILDGAASEKKQLIQKAYDWEDYKALEERRKK